MGVGKRGSGLGGWRGYNYWIDCGLDKIGGGG